MNNDNYSVDTNGIQMSKGNKLYIDSLVNDFMRNPPSSAFLSVSVSRERKKFKTVVRLNSFSVRIVSTQKSKDLNSSVKVAMHKMERRIRRWKMERFLPSADIERNKAPRKPIVLSNAS